MMPEVFVSFVAGACALTKPRDPHPNTTVIAAVIERIRDGLGTLGSNRFIALTSIIATYEFTTPERV